MPSTQFAALPPGAQQRIVEASLGEFAAHGYDAASTNRIVARAGISKGVLFKYFTDKESLFLYVAQDVVRSYLDGLPSSSPGSIFDFIQRTTVYKLRFFRERPLGYQLWMRIVTEPGHPVYAKAREQAVRGEDVDPFRQAIPPGTLREGVRPDHVVNVLTWIGRGMEASAAATLPDVADERLDAAYQAILDEFAVYLDILRYGAFREGGQHDCP